MSARNEPLDSKKARLKQFLQHLAEDPSLKAEGQEPPTMDELLRSSGITLTNEPVDMSMLVTELLRRNGIAADHEAMMEHVLKGGTVDDFMNHTSERMAT